MSFLKSSSGPVAAPSPTPSTSSNSNNKRKRPIDDVPAGTVHSQPADTGIGEHMGTTFGWAIKELQRRDPEWMTLTEIFDYLGPTVRDNPQRRGQLKLILQSPSSERIEWDGEDKFRYRPKLPVRNAEQLKGFLQQQKSAQGILVKDLKDGWPNVQEAIEVMERKKELLVTHNKKDGSARTIWMNDPTLMHKVDPSFLNEWHKIPLPANPDDLRNKLVAAGLKPCSAPKEIVPVGPKEKKKKVPRRGGRQTNTHMAGVLKDYSHKRK
ncbi:transcription initiation factor IIE, beta subunit [Delitschia confertaspora ATCC 74209]|uniref:Transcription initiation factor IIE subunit beta n=1 Tax=Delitschia confertaspora ATCC 74209 TaxID=1513339 RepID=A0A9P4JPJ1_9PLEO|nr:transcription initiation factor IIE, beta subunit [Delitschia confertaspora ATCC 74209]